MYEYIKKIISILGPFYFLLKRIRSNFTNPKIFYFIDAKDINKKLNNYYHKFTISNINKFFKNKETEGFFYLSDLRIKKEDRVNKYNQLIKELKKIKEESIVYDGNCPYFSEIISTSLLKKYSDLYPVESYPWCFYYFYKKTKFHLSNIGVNHRIYNFNGTFVLPSGGRTIGDGGPVDFRLNFIPDLSDKTFLDIGSEEGYSVFNACLKNAKFAKGLNIYEDNEYDFFPNILRPKNITSRSREEIEKTINFLKKIYSLEESKKISFEYKNIYDLKTERFDVVFCFGVLYHLKNPYLAIENLFEITNEILILETQGAYSSDKNYYGALISKDDGFIRHSPEALKFLLLKAGFKKVDILFSGVNKVKRISNIVLKAYKK